MPNYSKTVIYKIHCKDETIADLYVGHTTRFQRRIIEHKSRYTKNYNFKIYNIIRENGGWDNWTITQIEEFSCENQQQAKLREKYWVETLQSTLNMLIPILTKEESKLMKIKSSKNWISNNKEKAKQNKKIWVENNRDRVNELNKIYRNNKKSLNII
jgi:hypothetical protein